jgi:hypothetical protein
MRCMHVTARVVLALVIAHGLGCSQGTGAGGTSDPSRSGTHAEQAATVTRGQLRLAIRTRAYGEQVARLTDGPIIRPVAGDLVAVVMVDSPRTARGFGAADAEALGLPADRVYATALENTLAELTPLPGSVPPACGSVMAIQNGYYYESTRLLALSGRATTTTTAPVLVALPAYDTVLIGQDCGAESRVALAAIAGEVGLASPAPLSGTLFRVTVDGIVALTP